ncbi:cyclin-like protein [Paraphysoderma sedebokerense]|nr:cyclin-like protein [Paraphysoderma sedebokerense]
MTASSDRKYNFAKHSTSPSKKHYPIGTSSSSNSHVNYKPPDFIRKLGIWLKITDQTVSTAMVYLHRYQQYMKEYKSRHRDTSNFNIDIYLICTTCVLTACKVTEEPRKPRDILNVGYRLLSKDGEELKIGDTYWKLKESLCTAEAVLLRILNFQMMVDLPYMTITTIIRSELKHDGNDGGGGIDECTVTNSSVEAMSVYQLAWSFVNDCYLYSKIVLDYEPRLVGVACCICALRICRQDYDMEEFCRKYGGWDIEEKILDIICVISEFLSFHYDKRDRSGQTRRPNQQPTPLNSSSAHKGGRGWS